MLNYFNNISIIILLILSRAAVGAVGGINQFTIKLILTYSSINHSRWMLILITVSSIFSLNYFLIYSLITRSLLVIINLFNFKELHETKSILLNIFYSIVISFLLLSLGGLPPFTGFRAKILAIKTSINFYSFFVIFYLVIASLISLFYYIKITYNIFLISTPHTKILNLKIINSKFNLIIYLTLFGNLFLPILVLLT